MLEINTPNNSVVNVSRTLNSVLVDNSSFKTLKLYGNLTSLKSSMTNVSLNFWNLSTVTWGWRTYQTVVLIYQQFFGLTTEIVFMDLLLYVMFRYQI